MAPSAPLLRARVRSAAPIACALALGCRGLTDPPLPAGAERFAPPPVYARWWAMVEACSGATRPLGAVQFYRVPHAATIPDGAYGDVAGYWSLASNRIVVADFDAAEGGLVRHEMLHALLREPGHPRAAFLGRCAGVVTCINTCVRDAGPAPAPDLTAVQVGPDALEVTAAVAPAVPSLAVDSGLFTFVVRVRNPAPYPVTVVAPAGPPGFAALPVRYWFEIAGPAGRFMPDASGGASDPVGRTFAPGEVRQHVYDLSFAPGASGWDTQVPGRGYDPVLGPGRYVLTGGYANIYGGPRVTVPVVPDP